MNNMLVAMGRRIHELRTVAQMSQSDLGRRLGKSKQVVSAWELGRIDMTTTTLVAMSGIFNVSIDFITKGSSLGAPKPAAPYDLPPGELIAWLTPSDLSAYVDVLIESGKPLSDGSETEPSKSKRSLMRLPAILPSLVHLNHLKRVQARLQATFSCAVASFAMTVRDASMRDLLSPRDIAVIDPAAKPQPGQPVLVALTRDNGRPLAQAVLLLRRYRPQSIAAQDGPCLSLPCELSPLQPNWPTLTLAADKDAIYLGAVSERITNIAQESGATWPGPV